MKPTYEHTKLKPLSIALAVRYKTGEIVSANVATMNRKGHWAELSRRLYGLRTDTRREACLQVINDVRQIAKADITIASDSKRAYAHALESAFAKAAADGVGVFRPELRREMHSELMSHDPDYRGKPGLFRHEIGAGVYATIGGLGRPEEPTFNPAPPERLERSLKQTLEWMSDEAAIEMSRAGMGPGFVVRLACAHWHFEAVHPFSDGNGRVGRMLMALQMICDGYAPLYLSGYIEAHRKGYYDSLQAAQMKRNEAPLVHYLCEALGAAWEEARKTKAALLALPERWQQRGRFRAKSAARRALTELLEVPILTQRILQDRLGVSHAPALNAIDQLCAAGILRERTGMSRNRVFAAEEVIELLARPFGEPPETALEKAKALLSTF